MGHDEQPEPASGPVFSDAVRLIGDQPYLLIEFVPTGREVEIRMSSDRISCDGTVTGFVKALEAVIEEIRQ